MNSIKQPRDSNTKPRKGNLTMDPLLPMIPSGTRLPIGFKKIQYLIKLAFTVIINKEQRHSVGVVGFISKPHNSTLK